MEEVKIAQGSTSVSISGINIPIFWQGNVGTGKIRVLYGIIHKLLETEEENIFICDGK